MCGIFGYVGTRHEAPQLVLAGLKKLEYRGYDSWGIAARQDDDRPGILRVEKHVGKIGQARPRLPAATPRSATPAGRPTAASPRPTRTRTSIATGRLAVIHNGIIENHAELKRELLARGHTSPRRPTLKSSAHLLEEEIGRRGEAANASSTP